jgi:hypothetical protein
MELFGTDTRRRRSHGALFAIAFVVSLLATAFFSVQVLGGAEYAAGAESNRLRPIAIPRSTLVNLDRVREIHPWFNGEYVLTLHDGTRLESGWGYGKRVREAIRNPL